MTSHHQPTPDPIIDPLSSIFYRVANYLYASLPELTFTNCMVGVIVLHLVPLPFLGGAQRDMYHHDE